MGKRHLIWVGGVHDPGMEPGCEEPGGVAWKRDGFPSETSALRGGTLGLSGAPLEGVGLLEKGGALLKGTGLGMR